MIVRRSQTTTASPETIWATCFADLHSFAKWDPDVKEIITNNVNSDENSNASSCENGNTFTFVMNDGAKFPMKLSNVVKFESLTFSGNYVGIYARGSIHLTNLNKINQITTTTNTNTNTHDNTSKGTKVDYEFELKGFVGRLLALFKPRPIVEGTESGLRNIIKMSEENDSQQ